ncbi:hypothetical protein QEG73_19620 [Chitinophagaceae bacterium 26-R-25]|nr:hypothetical protein [Chitinophagaceae bacterium 26-R-25]
MNFYGQKVIDAFFQNFYHERIEIAKQVGKHYNKQLDISLLTFWFSVVDFYGGIYYIGKNNRKETYDRNPPNGHNLKFAHKQSFIEFIKDFFPAPENELGEFLYTVFRSGIVHQLSPKKGELLWDSCNPKLIWVKVDARNPANTANKVATINIYRLEQLSYAAYKEFRRKIEYGELVTECERIFNLLLAISDGLEDGITIHNQYDKLSPSVQTQITI